MDNVIYFDFRPTLEPMKIVRGQLERGINDGLRGLGFDRPDIAKAVTELCMPEIESVSGRFQYSVNLKVSEKDRAVAEAAAKETMDQLGNYFVGVQTSIMIALASVSQLATLCTTRMLDERSP